MNAAVSFVSLLLLLLLHHSCCYPDGAPNDHSVCKHLHPHHSHARSQKTHSPYSIVGKTKIPCGTAMNITIKAVSGYPYKGFIMQARPSQGWAKPLGTYTITDHAHSKTINCYELDNNTVTHSSPVLKNATSFVWTPPPKYKGQIIFHATVVKDYRTFWTNITAKTEVACSEGNDYIYYEEDELDNTGSSEDDHRYIESVHFTVYDECGLTKTCFGIPDDCVLTRSCDAMVTVTPRESKYEFEMLGVPYVAVSFSEDGNMSAVSMTECMLVNDANVMLYQTKYENSTGYLRQLPSNDLKMINSSYWDGVVYCKFVRDEEVDLNGVRFNFRTKKYFILLASGKAAPEQIQNNTKSDSVKFQASERNNYLSNVTGFSTSAHTTDSVRKRYGVKEFIFDFVFGVVRVVFNII